MIRPAVFFDRDNTLIISDGYLGDPARVVLIAGAGEAVSRIRKLGFATVVVSNQSGVARGLFDEAAVRAVNARTDELLRAATPSAVIDRHEYCPFHPDATVEAYRQESDLRKPKPGMLIKAAAEMELDLQQSWLIGDAPRDIEAGKSAGCRTILFIDPTLPASPATLGTLKVPPDYRVGSLKDAADLIEAHVKGPIVSPTTAPAALQPDVSPATGNVQASRDTGIMDQLRQLNAATEQIAIELRRHRSDAGETVLPRLLGGVAQVMVFAAMFIAYLERGNNASVLASLLWALVLQTLALTLYVMGAKR